MARFLPNGMRLWQQQADRLAIGDVIKMYESGFAGVWQDPDAQAERRQDVLSDGGSIFGRDAAHAAGWAGKAAGELVAPWIHVEKMFPGCWPGAAQERGDCVSHGQKNANLGTMVCEIIAGLADEVTGKLEGVPELTSAGITEGVLSTEWLYWFRGYNGDGWSCDSSASVSRKYGMMLRKAYAEIGVDFTQYSGSLAGKYGSRQPPEEMQAIGREHTVRTTTELQSFEEIRDFLANGYFPNSCGSEGFSAACDENGVAKRTTSWAHSMAIIGADDRPVIHTKYGGPLVLVMNSWGAWNGGGRRVLGTTVDRPIGSFWAKWNDVKNRYYVASSSVAGWPARELTDWGAGTI